MAQSRAMPFNTILALSALFSISSSTTTVSSSPSSHRRMEMPDSPPPPPTSPGAPSPWNSWNFASNGLPVSYRVAIIIDAFVLIVTVISLCLLGWYMRRQYRRRKLLALIHEREREVDYEYDYNGDVEGEGKLRGLEEGGMGGALRGVGKGGKKKGHVRWGSQVQGGSLELDSHPTHLLHTTDFQKAEPSTPSPTKISGMNWETAKGAKHQKMELDFSALGVDGNAFRVNGPGNGRGEKAKNSPMAREFKGDPLGKGKGVRVWVEELGVDGEREGYRKRGHGGSLLGEED